MEAIKNKPHSQTLIGFLFGHHWLTVYKNYCKTVANENLIDRAKNQLSRLRWTYFTVSFLAVSFLYLILPMPKAIWTTIATIFGIFATIGIAFKFIKQLHKAQNSFKVLVYLAIGVIVILAIVSSALQNMILGFLNSNIQGGAGTGVLTALYFVAIFVGYNSLLNWQIPQKFVVANHAETLSSNKQVSVLDAPDPIPEESFVIGTTVNNTFFKWNWDTKDYNSNLVALGQSHLYGKQLLKVFLWGTLGYDPNTVFVILDAEGGLDTAYLRHDYRELLEIPNIDDLFLDELMAELGSISGFPGIVIFNDDRQQDGIDWLDAEFERRRRVRNRIPDYRFPTRIVIVTDWKVTTALLNKKNNGVSYGEINKIVQQGQDLKMHVLAIAHPNTQWNSIAKEWAAFLSSLEFFHLGFVAEKGDKDKPEKEVAGKYVNVPPCLGNAKLWWKGRPVDISLLMVESDKNLAEFAYTQISKASPKTMALWQAVRQNKPYLEPKEFPKDVKIGTEVG